MTNSLEFNHCVMMLKGFSNSSLDADSIQKLLTLLFSLLSSFSFPTSFGLPLQKGQRTLPEQNLFPRDRANKVKGTQSPGWPSRKLPKVSNSFLYSSIAETRPPAAPLLTWQAKILPVRSVARVTTRSLPSRMMDPTLLHFTRRYRERRRTTLV